MLKHVSRVRLVGAWLTAVVLIFACRVVWGAAFTINSGQLWLAVCLVPPAVMLLVWRGARPLTVAELLHSVNSQSKKVAHDQYTYARVEDDVRVAAMSLCHPHGVGGDSTKRLGVSTCR
jgi:hypothetical protein